MKNIVSWFATNPVAANLLMLSLVVGGLMTVPAVKIELFPEFSLEMISVSVPYPGAAPEEVEEGICVPIEEELSGLEGIKKLSSTAVEGLGSVRVEVTPGEDPRRVLDDVKTRVDAISTFPEEAEKPVIEELMMRQQVINVAIYGDVAERTLKELGEHVRDDINALDGISQVELANARPYEISIEVAESELRRYGLDFDDVANAVRARSLDLSGGSIKTEGGEILLRTQAQAYVGADFEELVVISQPDGTRVLLRDVATVVDGFEDTDQSASFNGLPVVMVQVFRVGDESALEVSALVHDYVERTRPNLPSGVSISTWQDNAVWLQDRLDLLLENGLQGLLLVFLVLALFLKFRLSFWVTIGIPISFLGVLMLMPGLDQSLNMLSLFAFILVLGIVVDDAIVVGESIYQEHERGNHDVEGAVKGATDVAVPVIFAVLTTCVAFVPMAFLPGTLGKFFAVIPAIVIPALLFSVIESQWILPAHLSHQGKFAERLARIAPFRWWVALQRTFSKLLLAFATGVYRPTLDRALRFRYVAVAIGVLSLLLTIGATGRGWVKFVFFPDIEGDILASQVRMPQGTSVRATRGAVQQIEAAAEALVRELAGEVTETGAHVVRNVMSSVGEQPYLAQQQRTSGASVQVAPNLGEVVIELIPSEQREITGNEIARRWRELCGPIPGAVEVSFNSAVMSAGDAIDIQLAGRDVDELRSVAEQLKTALAGYPGVRDVTDSFRGGKEEAALDITPEAESLGLTRLDLARQVRQGFYGEEVQRIQRGRNEVKVMVRYPHEDRRTLFGLESMRIRTPEGAEVPFSDVAVVEGRRGYATIQRTNRQRTIHVLADVDAAEGNANEILAGLSKDVLPGIQGAHPGVHWSLEGQSNDQSETVAAMQRYFLMALFAIYGLMAIPFRSYLQPFIVMSAIPFGLVGAIIGHWIMGFDLSMLSVLGLAALAGVVVNDSLVLVDFVNRKVREGVPVAQAARQAGIERFRPILLTSLTTFAGLMPLILERSVQAQFLIPMAISMAFGVMFSTSISLVLVPCGYLILEDLGRFGRWLFGTSRPEGDPVVSESVASR